MVKPEWGTKRLCQSCGARFYDLQRSPIVCPACGAAFDVESASRPKRARPVAAKPVPAEETPAKAKKKAPIDDEVEVDEDDLGGESEEEESASPIEDASELGEDEDMSGVIDVEDDEEDR